MIIPALIPIAIGQYPAPGMLDGLAMQSITCYPVLCYESGVVDSQRNSTEEKFQGEIRSRSFCQKNASNLKSKYVLNIDSDTILTDTDAVQRLVAVLDSESATGAVALYFGKVPKIRLDLPHVNMKCMLYRRTIFTSIKLESKGSCLCNSVKEHINGIGLKVRYESFDNMAKEV